MGADCRVQLPANVRVLDVANVLGKLAGLPAEQYTIGNSKAVFVRVNGVTITPSGANMPYYVEITITPEHDGDNLIGGLKSCQFGYSFEGPGGARHMGERSRPWRLAVFRKLVNFFGGKLDYSDFDDIECDHYVPPKPNSENCPNTGAEWDALQLRILNLPALTEAAIEAERAHAYYKD